MILVYSPWCFIQVSKDLVQFTYSCTLLFVYFFIRNKLLIMCFIEKKFIDDMGGKPWISEV